MNELKKKEKAEARAMKNREMGELLIRKRREKLARKNYRAWLKNKARQEKLEKKEKKRGRAQKDKRPPWQDVIPGKTTEEAGEFTKVLKALQQRKLNVG